MPCSVYTFSLPVAALLQLKSSISSCDGTAPSGLQSVITPVYMSMITTYTLTSPLRPASLRHIVQYPADAQAAAKTHQMTSPSNGGITVPRFTVFFSKR